MNKLEELRNKMHLSKFNSFAFWVEKDDITVIDEALHIYAVMQRFYSQKAKYEKEYEELQRKLDKIYKNKKEPYILKTYEEKLVVLHGKIMACKEILENVV